MNKEELAEKIVKDMPFDNHPDYAEKVYKRSDVIAAIVEAMEKPDSPRWVKASEPEPLPKLSELDGVIIKHNPSPELFGGVAVHTLIGDYAIIKTDQERAAKLIGFKVRVREVANCYKTVEILWKESKPPHNTEIPKEPLSPTKKDDDVASDSGK